MSKNFRKEFISGVFYTGVGKYTGLFVSLIVTAILARLLTPNDFGIIAIATVIITFFNMISEIGIAPAIIQYKDLTEKDINIIYSLTVYIAIISSILFYFSVPFIADFYDNDILCTILQCLSISLFFAILNIVPNALFYKEKKFKLISIRTFIIQVIVGIISIVFALNGMGIYSLLVSPILSNIFIFFVSYKYYPQKFIFKIEKKTINKIFNFSSFQFLYNIINYFTRNLDKILIGKYIDMTSLGYYEKSYRLMMLPLSNISSVINPVLHPIFSDYQEKIDEMEFKYSKLVIFLSYIGVLLTIILYFAAEYIILIIYGEQWIKAVDIFQILSLSVFFQLIMSPCGAIYQATNSTKLMFYLGCIAVFTTILGFIIAINIWESSIAIAYSFTITVIANCIIGYVLLYKFIIKKRICVFFKKFTHPFFLFVLLFIIISLFKEFVVLNNIYLSFFCIASISLLIEFVYIDYFKIYDLRKMITGTKQNVTNNILKY